MLKLFSRMERTRNIVIVVFAILVAGSMVAVPGLINRFRNTAASPVEPTEVIAKVGSDVVTVADLNTLKESYSQMLGGQMNLAQLGGDKRFVDGLIRDRIVAQEAARLGLAASDAEVATTIRKRFTDASGKFMGVSDEKEAIKRYTETVSARYGDVERFERQVRDQIAAEKLQAFITAGVRVSEEEVQDDYKRKNITFDVVYVAVTAAKLAEKIQPSDEELRAYYEQRKTDYRILEPQKKIRYLFIDQAKMGEKLQVPDEELKAAFDKLQGEAKLAGVKVQQIVLKVARKDLDATVEAKAKSLVEKARGTTGNATEEAFAELARGNSEDPATAKNGGFLAKPVKKDPNKPDALYERAVDLQPGTVTDPIKYGGNWYILRAGEKVEKTFEQSKPELLVSMRNTRAYSSAAALAARAAELLKQSKDFPGVAKQLASEANMKPEEMVKETGYIKPGDDVPGIGVMQQFEQGIAALNNPNDVGERTPVKGGFAIPMLIDKKEPRIPDFDEVKDKVMQAVKQQRAKDQLEGKAKELADSVNSASDMKAAAEKLGLTAETAAAYKLGTPLGEAGTSPAADDAIYTLQENGVSKTPIKIGDAWVIVGATKRTEADLAEYAKQRDQLMQTALSARRNQVFDDYINAVQARMQQEGKIKIYDDVLARLAEDQPAALPQQPRLPIRTK